MGIPKTGSPRAGTPKVGKPHTGTLPGVPPKVGKTHTRTLTETEIPKPGIPKSGIPKTRERKLNSNFSGASGISRQKCLIPWFRETCRTFWPPPHSRGRPHTPTENIRTQKFGFGFFFVPKRPGIPKLGIPKTCRFRAPLIQTPSELPKIGNENSAQSFSDRRFWRKPLSQQVLNLTPLNPTPATCHKRKRKLHCSFRSAALQELHCNVCFSAVRKSFGPKAALQQAKNCTAISKKLRCRKVALSCRFPADFKPPRLGTHVSDLLT